MFQGRRSRIHLFEPLTPSPFPSLKVRGIQVANATQWNKAFGRATHVSGLEKILDAMNDELTDEEKSEIQEIFFEAIVPKLKKLDARLGTISCEFAGPRYANWMIQFRSRGEEFEIVDFEYDAEAAGIDLDV